MVVLSHPFGKINYEQTDALPVSKNDDHLCSCQSPMFGYMTYQCQWYGQHPPPGSGHDKTNSIIIVKRQMLYFWKVNPIESNY